jgi:hypothetical protein
VISPPGAADLSGAHLRGEIEANPQVGPGPAATHEPGPAVGQMHPNGLAGTTTWFE